MGTHVYTFQHEMGTSMFSDLFSTCSHTAKDLWKLRAQLSNLVSSENNSKTTQPCFTKGRLHNWQVHTWRSSQFAWSLWHVVWSLHHLVISSHSLWNSGIVSLLYTLTLTNLANWTTSPSCFGGLALSPNRPVLLTEIFSIGHALITEKLNSQSVSEVIYNEGACDFLMVFNELFQL